MARVAVAVVIPVYRNEQSLPALVSALDTVAAQVAAVGSREMRLRATFVVDGSPDQSEAALHRLLPAATFDSQVVCHSRNFGSMAAVRTGMSAADADHYAVIAADLQEPPDVIVQFVQMLAADKCDIAVGVRISRQDPLVTKVFSTCFWRFYKTVVNREFPSGGVDVFACNRKVRDALVGLTEANTSLIGQLFWLGFRRAEVPYERQKRRFGKSAWTLSRKVSYMLDSVFAFTDLPIRLLGLLGVLCLLLGSVWAVAIVVGRLLGNIEVSGFSALAVMVLLFGGINSIGVSIAGIYAWRAYENTKQRPLAMTSRQHTFAARHS